MKKIAGKQVGKLIAKEELHLPFAETAFDSILSDGNLLEVDGTNVVRVPFGVRSPKRKRPERTNKTWATLVLPFQSPGTPTPPPHAA